MRGKKLNFSFLNSTIFMFSIIKTNRNKIAIAPTQTIISVTGIKSSWRKKINEEKLKKDNTKNSAENTGLADRITKIELNIAKLKKQ